MGNHDEPKPAGADPTWDGQGVGKLPDEADPGKHAKDDEDEDK